MAQNDVDDIGKAMPEIFKKAEISHLRASLSDRLEPAGFMLSPEALAAVRAAAEISGEPKERLVSTGIALAVEMLCRREGPEFRTVFQKRQAQILKTLDDLSAAAPAAEK